MSFGSPRSSRTLRRAASLALAGYLWLQRRPPRYAISLHEPRGARRRSRAASGWRRHVPAGAPARRALAPLRRGRAPDACRSRRPTEQRDRRARGRRLRLDARDGREADTARGGASARSVVRRPRAPSASGRARRVRGRARSSSPPTVDRKQLEQGIDVADAGLRDGDRRRARARASTSSATAGDRARRATATSRRTRKDRTRRRRAPLRRRPDARPPGPGRGSAQRAAAGRDPRLHDRARHADGGTVPIEPLGAGAGDPRAARPRDARRDRRVHRRADRSTPTTPSALELGLRPASAASSRRTTKPREVTAAFVGAGGRCSSPCAIGLAALCGATASVAAPRAAPRRQRASVGSRVSGDVALGPGRHAALRRHRRPRRRLVRRRAGADLRA